MTIETSPITQPNIDDPFANRSVSGFMDHLGRSRLARIAACGTAALALALSGCEGEGYDGPPVTVDKGEGVFNHPDTRTQCGTTTAKTHEYPTLWQPTSTAIDTMYGWNKPTLSGVENLPGKSCGVFVWTFGTQDAKKK